MKKYIVVKHNLMRKQSFYMIHKSHDSWSVDKAQAHKFFFRRTAEKIAKAMTNKLSPSLSFIVEYRVEEVD